MNGTLAQIIALTAYGNAYLNNGTIPTDFDSANTTFQFCANVDFREIRKLFFFSKPKEHVIASSPTEWFKYLKVDGCKHLRLYFENSKDQSSTKDHRLAGFVGGGGTWLIEAIYGNYSNFWANRWGVKNQNAADRKIWAVSYRTTAKKQHTNDLQIDNQLIKDKLNQTLTEIAAFAYKHNLQHWGDLFDKAKATLDSSSPSESYYHKDLIPLDNYSLIAKQILFAAGHAWVFGGMGSWNDLGFDNEDDNNIYDELSEQLYLLINMAIIAATNTY